jgi:DNA-directed RNA polymerase subunit beta'
VKTPQKKKELLDKFEKEAEKVENQFRRGIITDGERRNQEVRIWTEATEQVREAMEAGLKSLEFNPIDMMVGSGARGNMMQVRQIAGMRGLVANPRGDMIPRPIKSNFREGLEMLEYFIATPGARKGLVDTALRTADSGYLTRRLVDVAQELIVRGEDCGTTLGLWVDNVQADTAKQRNYLETKLFGRALAQDVTLADGTVIARNTVMDDDIVDALRHDPEVTRVRVRSVLTCDAEQGICALCYGRSLATGKSIELGEAVGVIAAQSIGEPGTQLTMRTFHTGGVAGRDIAGGLPRVVELFEARTPRGAARLARASGVVRISEDEGRGIPVSIETDDGEKPETVTLPSQSRLIVRDGDDVRAGDPITDGPFDPKELMEIKGVRETQQYLVEEVQKVYRDQGVSIHDKHIELIVRQMTRRIGVQEPGDTDFLPGERVDQRVFREMNKAMVEAGSRPAEGRPEIMGITKASLATESWLSAASFQETTRVLTEAAIDGRADGLLGLKENIIIGKLIPAGTGMPRYREFDIEAPDYQPMEFYSSDTEDPAEWLASISGTFSADEGGAAEG